jgi:ribosome-associated protein
MIQIRGRIAIPEEELRFIASRSGGPGGQNVNKVSTKVTLLFDVANSPSLSQEHKRIILKRLDARINRDGVLRVVSQRFRSQAANRNGAVERFVELLQDALRPSKPRVRTRIPMAAKERRLSAKRRRGVLKKQRSKEASTED